MIKVGTKVEVHRANFSNSGVVKSVLIQGGRLIGSMIEWEGDGNDLSKVGPQWCQWARCTKPFRPNGIMKKFTDLKVIE